MQKELPQYYTVLFNAVTDAIDLIANKREQDALTILVTAQQTAEDIYIAEG